MWASMWGGVGVGVDECMCVGMGVGRGVVVYMGVGRGVVVYMGVGRGVVVGVSAIILHHLVSAKMMLRLKKSVRSL